MKKRILLISLLFMTGCSVNYNLEFKDNKIYEEITGTVSEKELQQEEDRTDVNPIYEFLYIDKSPLIEDDTIKYNKEIIDKGNSKEYTFKYTYDNNYDKSTIINRCFQNRMIEEDDSSYYIRLGGNFSCLSTDKIVIKVKSSYAVLEHNADKVKKGEYIWTINEKNQDNVDIKMSISKKITSVDNSDTKILDIPKYKIVCFIILLILSAVAYLLYKKNEQNKL